MVRHSNAVIPSMFSNHGNIPDLERRRDRGACVVNANGPPRCTSARCPRGGRPRRCGEGVRARDHRRRAPGTRDRLVDALALNPLVPDRAAAAR